MCGRLWVWGRCGVCGIAGLADLVGPGGLGLPVVVGKEPVVVYEASGKGIVHCGRLGLLYEHHVLGVLRVLRGVHLLHVFHRGLESWDDY